MKKRSILMLSVLLLSVISAAIVLRTNSLVSYGTVWHVGDGFQFANITAAVNFENVTDGDIIEVTDRITNYSEYVTVNKSLTIRHYSSQPNQYPTLNGGFNVTSPSVTIEGFIIQSNRTAIGICLYSSDNTIINNTLRSNWNGIYIGTVSTNNTLENNRISDGFKSFVFADGTIDHFVQRIDASNTVDGKPMVYVLNEHDIELTSAPGYLGIVNSSGIIVKNLSETVNGGIMVAYSSQVTVENLSTYNKVGLYHTNDSTVENNPDIEITLQNSNQITVQNNRMQGSFVELDQSNNNILLRNVVEGSGVQLTESNNNSIIENNITQRSMGMRLYSSNDSRIFHNNFECTPQLNAAVDNSSFNNSFDNGYEGNYWDDYQAANPQAVEIDKTGIWNMSYTIYQAPSFDRYPLVEKWTTNRVINVTYSKNKISFITISSPNLVRVSTNLVHVRRNESYSANESILGYFNFSVTAATPGYFNIIIPRDRLDSPFEIYINDAIIQEKDYQLNYTRDYSSIYHQYGAGRYLVQIVGLRIGNLLGDLNDDGVVNMRDIVIVILNFNQHE